MTEISAMYEALDNMDDYALMANVKPIGPHKVLTDAIAELEQLRQRVAELEKERDELKLVVSAHADFFSSTQSEMADLKESVECLSATNDFLIGKRDENIILKAAVKQLTAERDELNNIAENIGDLHHVTLDEWAAMKAERDALKQQIDALVEAAIMAVEMIEYNKHERRHVRWQLNDAIASVKEKS